MSAQGPNISDSVTQLQDHSLDYGKKCRNACYSGVAAAWALHTSGNIGTLFFGLSIFCLLSTLYLDIWVSSSGVNLLISRIAEAQKRGNDFISFTAEEAAEFAKNSGRMKWLVLAGFVFMLIGFLVSTFHVHAHIHR